MKYLIPFVFLIILYGCGTTPKKTEESLPSFTLTNNFRYNEQITYYTSKNGILKDSVGLSFKQLPIKNSEGQNISCRYKLLGGTAWEGWTSDNRDDLIRRVECSFGVLDTSNGFSWRTELVNEEEITPLLSMNFEIVPEEERFYPDTARRLIVNFKRSIIRSLKDLMTLKQKYQSGYTGSDEEKKDIHEIDEEENKNFALSTGDKIVAIVQFSPTSKKKSCSGITYKPYKDWEKSTALHLTAIDGEIYRLKKEIGL
jgi:hypothetical protein